MKSLLRLFPALLLLFALAGCGGSSSGGTTTTTNSIAIQLSSATLTIAQGSSGSDTVTVTRTGTTGNVTLSVSGLPTGATATFTDPVAGNSGQIAIATTAATLSGTYPLTVKATDGTYSATASLSLVITAVSNSIALQLSSATLTVSQGSSGSDTVTVTRTGTTGNVTLSLTGLPTGATATFTDPAAGDSGQITIATTAVTLSGTYPLTVQATDGTYSATASLSLVISIVPQISTSYSWTSTGPLISAIADSTHPIVSVKDPTVVYYNGQWNVYATTADTSGNWNMVYLNFTDWSQAAAATPYYMDATTGFSGYHCAPELFYFQPQNKWYLIYQSGPPQYSTTDDPTKPATWTAPQSFFSSQPSTVSNWIDFWVICDSSNCYLFFSGDNGNYYRSQTTLADFPSGFSTPQIIMQDTNNIYNLYEGSNVYSVKGTGQYLALIEALGGSSGQRFFRAFVTDHLDGDWTPLSSASSWATPFIGENNVTFDSGVTAWTTSFSHGEMIRDGYDQTLEIDPSNLQFLYQGADPSAYSSDSYSQIPWQLGLVTATSTGK